MSSCVEGYNRTPLASCMLADSNQTTKASCIERHCSPPAHMQTVIAQGKVKQRLGPMHAPCLISSTGRVELQTCHLLIEGEHKLARQNAQHNAGSIGCMAGNMTTVCVCDAGLPSKPSQGCCMVSFAQTGNECLMPFTVVAEIQHTNLLRRSPDQDTPAGAEASARGRSADW